MAGQVLLTHHAELCLTLAIHVYVLYFVQLRIAKVNPILLLSTCSTCHMLMDPDIGTDIKKMTDVTKEQASLQAAYDLSSRI